ncbi:MAG: FHA domain-containing protein [Pirellulales bacterium]
MAFEDPIVELDLLDSAQGHPVQSWRFVGRTLVVIGRAEENDVRIVDPRVSRVHAELHYSPAGWILVSRGRNGVVMDGVQVTNVPLSDRLPFQLGPGGPQMRFRLNGLSSAGSATLDNLDTSMLKMVQIDLQKRDEEVRGITEGALFQQLKQRAGELRKRWQSGGPDQAGP